MINIYDFTAYFSEVETTKEHKGYFCSVADAITIVILGSFCGLRNVSQIHQWASSERVSAFLGEHCGISSIPCYYWLLCLLKIIRPESLNRCFISWVDAILGSDPRPYTIAVDGKTMRSTGKMASHENPLHIVSAHIAELGITFGQKTVPGKSNEIPAVQDLLGLLNIEGCIVVADALNCQKETAKTVVGSGGDYLLSVKGNHETLENDIRDYVQDRQLRKTMDVCIAVEKNGGRTERRTAYTTSDIHWLHGKEDWVGLSCIGAVHTQFTRNAETSDAWHYYISSRKLDAKSLLHHARLEWSVETMHWMLDVNFGEDSCRIEDSSILQNLNILRKAVLNCISAYKAATNTKRAVSKLMFDCLLDPFNILPLLPLQN